MIDAETQEEKIARQALLAPIANPAIKRDSLSSLSGTTHIELFEKPSSIDVTLTYAPDRFVVTRGNWNTYLQHLGSTARFPSLEAFADTILDDVNNEIVPRWLQVQAKLTLDEHVIQTVLVEDRQPNWDNAALLYRAPRL